MTLLWGAVLFVAGAGILIASVEGLVESVIKRAAAIGVSGLALGLLATSLDPESTATGVAAAFKNLPGVAMERRWAQSSSSRRWRWAFLRSSTRSR